MRTLRNLIRDWRSNAAYRRFQRACAKAEKAAQARHAPTRDITAKRTATVHAALRGRE